MKRIFLLVAVFVFINSSGQVGDSTEEIEMIRSINESWYENVVGKALPDFTAKDLNGKIYSINTIKDKKITFVNFWFAACAPCIAEIPNLNRLFEMTKDDFEFQFFTISWDPEAEVKEVIKKYDIHFPVLLTSPREASRLTFGRGYPTNMILDKEGKICSILSGGWPKPGTGFESYWKHEIEKSLKGFSSIEVPKSAEIPSNKSNIIFIDSHLKIESLNALTNHFKGKSLFIDLWASWCLPCRQDFNSKNSLDSFLNKYKIAQLFISIDDPKATDVWKNLIYEYRLNGYHLLAGDELIKDLKQRIYKNQELGIPRYIIVKKGKIVELNAFRPSDTQKLLKQLTEKLL